MGTPLRLMPSPLRPMNQHGMSTPSPVRLGPSSFFATPGMFAGTPVTEAMAISSWLQDLVKGIPAKVRHPALLRIVMYHKACFDDAALSRSLAKAHPSILMLCFPQS